jgi:hypothetical protein
MKHSVYLIDYENISYKGLFGIGSIQADDEIIIFYSNSIAIIKDILSAYQKINIKIKYFCLEESGKNALDFMITTYIGYYASKDDIGRISVISKDKGYTSIKPVIDDINKDIELCFESCIHNVIFPDKKTEINIEPKKEVPDKKNNSKIQDNQKINFINMSDNKKREFVLNLIESENKIKNSYIQPVSSLIIKYINNKNTFIQQVTKQIGTSPSNQCYKKEAEKYYDRIKKLYEGDKRI